MIDLSGAVTATVSGSGDTLTFGNNCTVSATSGSGDTFNLGSGANLTSDGQGNNTINAGAGSTLEIGGGMWWRDTVNASGDQITLDSGGTSVNVVGGGNAITAGNSSSLMASGDTITYTGTGDYASLNGSGDTITASNASLNIAGTPGGATDTITGSGNTISASNSAITFAGSGDTLYGNSNTITAGAENFTVSGYGDTISGSSDQITLLGNSSIIIQGNTSDSFVSIGINNTVIDNLANGTSVVDNWNSSGTESIIGYTGADGSGQIIGGGGSGGSGGAGGSSGYAGNQSTVTSAVGSHLSAVVQYDLNHGELTSVATAQTQYIAFKQSLTTPEQPGAAAVVLNGAKWNQPVITWSLADNPGTPSAPFSSYMTSDYAATVQEAFGTWAALMPGVKFEQVSDSSQSDIRLGFGDLNSPATSLIGYTTPLSSNGQMLPDSIIRVEDPTQDPLVTGSNGQQMYAGTDASLLQVLTHEIGHTLGLADNADPNSIMYYALSSNNTSLDSTDVAGINSLYGPRSNASTFSTSSVNQLIQAMATFNTGSGAAETTPLVPAALLVNNTTLAPPVTVH